MVNICKKTITFSIILLLIGVSVSSAISVDTKSTISNNESDECRDCQEVSKSDLVKVESLLGRVDVYSKLLLVLNKYNSELKEMSEELLDEISTLTDMFKELTKDRFPNLCFALTILLQGFAILTKFFQDLWLIAPSPSFEENLFRFFYEIFYTQVVNIIKIMEFFGCERP